MPEQVVSFSVDTSLLQAFEGVVAKNACNNNELLRAFMMEYVQYDIRRHEYDTWFRCKVAHGLEELHEGKGLSQDQALAHMCAFKASFAHTERTFV